jgi:hypothetical protein
MEKQFCTCTTIQCPCHPCNHDKGCDLCIQKNLELGEIPACFWVNISNGVTGSTEYSVENFTKFYLEHKAKNDE